MENELIFPLVEYLDECLGMNVFFVYLGDGDIFQYDCNTCTCVDGTKVCTDKDCKVVYSNGKFMRLIQDYGKPVVIELKVCNSFLIKAPSEIFERILNTPLNFPI